MQTSALHLAFTLEQDQSMASYQYLSTHFGAGFLEPPLTEYANRPIFLPQAHASSLLLNEKRRPVAGDVSEEGTDVENRNAMSLDQARLRIRRCNNRSLC
jgi:hypothetical protein